MKKAEVKKGKKKNALKEYWPLYLMTVSYTHLDVYKRQDDPVRLVSTFVEEMDLSELYKTYGRIRKNQAICGMLMRYWSSSDDAKSGKTEDSENSGVVPGSTKGDSIII